MSDELKVWRKVQFSNGLKSGNDYRDALISNRFAFDEIVSEIVDKKSIFREEVQNSSCELVKISVAEMGLEEASYEDVCFRAQELGLSICSPHVGLQLRLQYPDQANYDLLHIAMEPILISRKTFWRFALFGSTTDNSGSRCALIAVHGDKSVMYSSSAKFVFLAPGESLVTVSRPARYPVLLILAAVLGAGILVGLLVGSLIKNF